MKNPAALALALVLLGCSAFAPIEPPDVTLVDLEFSELTVFETSGMFTVRIANPNPDPLVVDGGVYRLYLNGMKIGKGLSSTRLEVPRLGSATDEVPIYLNNLAMATRLREILEGGELDYLLKTKLYVEGSFGRRRLTSDFSGSFDFRAPLADEPLPPPGGIDG